MYRCALLALALCAPSYAAAQVQRNFPQNALRGELTVGMPPEVLVNGRPGRLAPGARVRGPDNMIVMSGAIAGQRHTAHYTLDTLGLVKDVWLLRADETDRFWPKSDAEATRFTFDPVALTWTKP